MFTIVLPASVLQASARATHSPSDVALRRKANSHRRADTLAAAYAEAGRFDDAVAEQKRSIELLLATGRKVDVGAARSRLDLYRSGQPYRM